MNSRRAFLTQASSLLLAPSLFAEEGAKPLNALLVIGGCCHDYSKQKDVLKAGLEARANLKVEIAYSPDTSTKAMFEVYAKENWWKAYDVIIHDECSADVKDMTYVESVLAPHRAGIPAVNLHCAMHCYRTGTPDWFEFCGIQSSRHGPQLPIEISLVDKEHPITKGLPEWTTIKEELYNNLKVYDSAHALAKGKQQLPNNKVDEHVVIWTNEYRGKARVFNTTLGHNTETVADGRYLDLLTRGLLWSCDKLNPAYTKAVK